MNVLSELRLQVELSRFRHNVNRKKKKRLARRKKLEKQIKKNQKEIKNLRLEFGGAITYEKVLLKWLPPNILYAVCNKKSDLHIEKLKIAIPEQKKLKAYKILKIPANFSLILHPEESYSFIKEAITSILFSHYAAIDFSYENCEGLDIGAQVYLDILLSEIIIFFDKCAKNKYIGKKIVKTKSIGLTNIHKNNIEINKILFSVGSPAIHRNASFNFRDIIPYKLHSFCQGEHFSLEKAQEQKDIETTNLALYVEKSLNRLNKKLTPEKMDNLCIVIGETLINAEEHSTNKHRFSIGYFKETKSDGKHFGVFRLIIMNFGQTIYEKFKDPKCPNQNIVRKMKELSESYKNKRFYIQKIFDEEELWTLYALQERVTSVSSSEYKKRGNGSIRFIESFFEIKGDELKDDESRMTILSGNTNITFDGSYKIQNKKTGNDLHKVMTFNNSGDIRNKPDEKYVKSVANYFPGTVISVRVYFEESDFTNEQE